MRLFNSRFRKKIINNDFLNEKLINSNPEDEFDYNSYRIKQDIDWNRYFDPEEDFIDPECGDSIPFILLSDYNSL